MNQSRVAVVTGGTGVIGRDIARRLTLAGLRVAVFDSVSPDAADDPSSAVCEGEGFAHYRVDVSDEVEVADAMADLRSHWGPATVLVNNAAIFPRGPSVDMSVGEWRRVIETNLVGTFICSRLFARIVLEGNPTPESIASIVNIGSGRQLAGAVDGSAYAASKGGILSLTRSLALEWAPAIRVNMVIPGLTDTAQPRAVMGDEDFMVAARAIPMQRIGEARDVSEAVCFLVSESSQFITGQSLCVNGGFIMQ